MKKIMGVTKERAKEIKAMVREELARADEVKEENEKISRAILARQEFVAGGVTAEKLYQIENRLDDVMYQLRDRFGIFFGDKTVDEIHDIRLIIEWFGKQIDPVILNKIKKMQQNGEDNLDNADAVLEKLKGGEKMNKDKTSKSNEELSFDDWFDQFKLEFERTVYGDLCGDETGGAIKSAYKEISRFDKESQKIVIEWINEVVQFHMSLFATTVEVMKKTIADYNLEDPKKAVEQIEDEDY